MMTASPLDPYSTAANAWRPQPQDCVYDEDDDDELKNLMDALSPEDQACIRMLLRGANASPQTTAFNNAASFGQQFSYSPLNSGGDLSPESTAASSSSCKSAIVEAPQPSNSSSNHSPANATHKDTAASSAAGMSLTARRRKARRQNRVVSCSRSPAVDYTEGPVSPASGVSEVIPTPVTGPTTMMIRNVPKRYSQRMLIQELASRGFEGTFDFFYLPTDISSGRNLGYGFVNFLTPALAATFKSVFHKIQLSGTAVGGFSAVEGGANNSSLSISVAVVQGLKRNLDNLVRNASVHRIKNPEYLPLVMDPAHGCLAPYMIPSHKASTQQQQHTNGRRHSNDMHRPVVGKQ